MPMPTACQKAALYDLSLLNLFDKMTPNVQSRVMESFIALYKVYSTKPIVELWLTAIADERDKTPNRWL